MTLVLLAYFLSGIFTSWIRHLYFWWITILPLGPLFWHFWIRPHGIDTAWNKAEAAQKRLKSSKQAAAFLAALIEFQKAQVFFTLAVQVAAFVAFSSKENSFDADSYEALFDNYAILSQVAVNGCFCVVFGLFLLRLNHQSSWYIIVLSNLAAILCTVTYFKAQNDTVSQDVIHNDSPTLDKCANVTPSKYCYSYNVFYAFSQIRGWFPSAMTTYGDVDSTAMLPLIGGKKSAIYFSCFMQLVLFLDHIAIFPCNGTNRNIRQTEDDLPRSGFFLKKLAISNRTRRITTLQLVQNWILSMRCWDAYERAAAHFSTVTRVLCIDDRKSTLRTVIAAFRLVLELVFFITILNSLLDLTTEWSLINAMNWTFGQVIAVTVWAPVIIEWVYMTICKFSLVQLQPLSGFESSDPRISSTSTTRNTETDLATGGIEEASHYRIPKPYQVRKVKSNEIIIDRICRDRQLTIQSEAELVLMSNAQHIDKDDWRQV